MKKQSTAQTYATTASTVTLQPYMSIPWLISERLKARPSDVCIEKKSRFGSYWQEITISAFDEECIRVARGLIGLGLNAGDAIAIFGATSYEWSLIDIAALKLGVIVVPIYESDSAEQIEWILNDANVRHVFTDTAAHAALVESVRTKQLGQILLMDEDGLVTLESYGTTTSLTDVALRSAALTTDTIATIIYTSGTTGKPKGVELTHGNLVFSTLSVFQSEAEIIDRETTRILLFLPLAHIMARIVFLYGIAGHGRVGHVASTENLISDLASFKPTALLVVPRVLEKIYNAAEAKTGGGKKLKIFRWAAQVSFDNSRKTFHGPFIRIKRLIASKLVWSKLRAVLGKDCVFAVSAGAPLGKRLGHIYRGIGLTVVEAFGLTETTGPSTANTPDAVRMGSVGRPIPGTEVRIADDGEVLLRGPHILRGYRNNPEATANVLEADGWFHTGDIGSLDADGYLSITGRKKDLIVTAGGKNVAPAVLEDPLSGHPLISQVVVVGDGKPFVGALITLDAQMLPGWLSSHDLPSMSVKEAVAHPAVLSSLQRAIERTNKQVSRAESIRKFVILSGEFTQDNGLLTPSMKVKRSAVQERFAKEIEELYTDTRSQKNEQK